MVAIDGPPRLLLALMVSTWRLAVRSGRRGSWRSQLALRCIVPRRLPGPRARS